MATVYQRGGSWYLQDGEAKPRVRRSLGAITDTEAKAALEEYERNKQSHPDLGPFFESWALEYCQWHSLEYPDSYFRTEQIIRQHLGPAFLGRPIGGIAKRDVEKYKHDRVAAGASVGTVTKELRTLQALLNKAVEWEVIPKNRSKGVEPPKALEDSEPRWYTKEELDLIYRRSPVRWPVWKLMVNTGLRRGEAQQIRWRDFSKEAVRIVSEPGARTKSAKWRLVPMSPGAVEALERLKPARVTPDQLVLPDVTAPSLSRAFLRTVHVAQLDGSLHSLRHTFCSHLVMAGVPLVTVQRLAGHSTIRVTEKYAHLAPGYLQDSVKGLSL